MRLFTPVLDVKKVTYCGPTAIAALTGVPVSRIEKMIRRCRGSYAKDINGRRIPIKGTYTGEVLKVLKRLGCKVEPQKPSEKTFGRFVDDTRHIDAAFLVEVTGHWMAASKGMICDTSNIEPLPVDDYRRKKRIVRRVWKVIAPEAPKYTINDPISPKRERKSKPDLKLVRAKKLAEQIAFWESKEKRAKTALKKLRPRLRRYEKLGVLAATAA